MDFRLKVRIEPSALRISHEDKLMMLGSCFTENIGKLLAQHKFDIDINPFGITYNPISIVNGLDRIIDGKRMKEEDLFFYNDRWNSYAFHGRFSDESIERTLLGMNKRIEQAAENIQKTNILLLTFGTSFIYRLKTTNEVVNNCHKLPAEQFEYEMVPANEIIKVYVGLLEKLVEINPSLQILLTISPVRHWKNGYFSNNLSKSNLVSVIHYFINRYSNVNYFPAYEILLDELRDYRFYEDDMLHPNKLAIRYIWEKFSEVYFVQETKDMNRELQSIIQAKNHKPFNPNSKSHLKFRKTSLNKINDMKARFPYLNLDDEEMYFSC